VFINLFQEYVLIFIGSGYRYFDVSATKEILDEFLPQIYPWTSDTNLMCQMVVFLPVALPPKHAEQGHKLWFDKLMELWDTCYNSQCGVSVSHYSINVIIY
jgi:hypothetical protein